VITFYVEGRPAAKGSRIAGKRKDGTVFTRPASKYEKPWTDAVKAQSPTHPRFRGPYVVELEFIFKRPKKPSYPYPVLDLDKIVRATLDGLQFGRVISDDKHVVEVQAMKRWALPGETQGCLIDVRPAD
jgi:Holliday junction resolvase RusA-like endonuclease